MEMSRKYANNLNRLSFHICSYHVESVEVCEKQGHDGQFIGRHKYKY